MTESLRHHRNRHTRGEHQRRLSVPQVMQPDSAQPRSIGESVEPLGDVGRRHRLSVFPGEDQAVVDVELAPLRAFGFLLEPLGHQDTERGAVEVDHAGVAARGLGGAEANEAMLSSAELALDPSAVDLDELLAHDDHAAGEVDVIPSENCLPRSLTPSSARLLPNCLGKPRGSTCGD